MKPYAVELFCGCFGGTAGFIELGIHVVGFDLEHLPHHGHVPDGASLVLQDCRTLHGSQFRDACFIWASPPCTEFSWMSMPWSRAKQVARALRGQDVFPDGYTGSRTIGQLTELFDTCFRIQREACAAAGRHIPMIVENVRGAQPWVGRSRANFGSYHLYGDVPALMPMTQKRQVMKNGITHRSDGSTNFHGQKNNGGSWFAIANNTTSGHSKNPVNEGFKTHGMNWSNLELRGQDFTRIAGKQAAGEGIKGVPHRTAGHWTNPAENEGVKFSQSGAAWFDGTPRDKMLGDKGPAAFGSKSSARKAASAVIAKIPFPLARYLARVFKPQC